MKNLVLIAISLLFILTGCDRQQPPKEIDLDTIYDTLPSYDAQSCYPYDSFSTLFDKSFYYLNNLPAQKIDREFAQIYYESNFEKKALYLDYENNLILSKSKEKNSSTTRSLIAQSEPWFTSQTHYFVSQVRAFKPKTLQRYSFMQAHGVFKQDANRSIYYNYPLVDIRWEREYDDRYDHLWAVIIKSSPSDDEPKIYDWVDLGARQDNHFSLEVHIAHNILEVKVDYKTKYIQNVSYWERVPTYFSAGVILNSYIDGGEAGVSFKELRFENDAANVENITHF